MKKDFAANLIVAGLFAPLFGIILSGFYFLYHVNWEYIIIPDFIKEKVTNSGGPSSFIFYKEEMINYWTTESIKVLPFTTLIAFVSLLFLETVKDRRKALKANRTETRPASS